MKKIVENSFQVSLEKGIFKITISENQSGGLYKQTVSIKDKLNASLSEAEFKRIRD